MGLQFTEDINDIEHRTTREALPDDENSREDATATATRTSQNNMTT